MIQLHRQFFNSFLVHFLTRTVNLQTSNDQHVLLCVGGTWDDKLAQVYDPASNRWFKAANTINDHYYTAVTTRGNKVVVAGSYYMLSKAAEQYDPETDSWSRLCDLRVGRDSFALVNLDGDLFAIGGAVSNETETNSVETLKANGDNWEPGPSMLTARYGHTAAVISVSIRLTFIEIYSVYF